MADRIVTMQDVMVHVAAHCPNLIDVRTLNDRGPVLLCGCGNCPEPDPTPEQLQARVDAQWWRLVSEG